jgi:hypothetical protein
MATCGELLTVIHPKLAMALVAAVVIRVYYVLLMQQRAAQCFQGTMVLMVQVLT